MTSKSSFLVNLKENSKRRLWVWVISALVFMLVFPVMTAIVISQINNSAPYLSTAYTGEALERFLHGKLIAAMREQLGFFSARIIAVLGIAVISAVQGFSYLYSRKKMDFYMGMPVKRKKRFLVIWLNGILIYVLPALIGILIEILIAAGNGAMDRSVLGCAAFAFLADFWLYLGVYHLALLAVMMTGNVIITGFGIVVFFLYEYVVRWTLNGYKSFFFRYFNYYNVRTEPVLSPVSLFSNITSAFMGEKVTDFKSLAMLILFSVITGAIVYVCYVRRPAEAAGRAMAFDMTKPAIKVLLAVPASLLAGLVIAEMVGYDPMSSSDGMGYMIFVILAVVVIGSALIQVIYEFDLKGALHKKREIIISGMIAALVFVIFQFDLLGFDAYVPEPEQVESIAFIPQNYEQNTAYFDEEGNYLSEEEFADRYMYLHNVEEVCELARHSIEGYDQIGFDFQRSYDEEKEGRWSESTVLYRLKNGRTVCRRLLVNVDDEQTIGLLDRIIGSREFKEGYMTGVSAQLQNLIGEDEHYKIKANYGNTVYRKEMSRTEAAEFLEIYREEVSKANFTNIRENMPEGALHIQISEEIPGSVGDYEKLTRSWYVNINIYSFYEECLDYLRTRGYYMDYQLNPEDVAYIQIMNRNNEIYQKLTQEASDMPAGAEAAAVIDRDYESDLDTRVYAEYTGKEEIEQIAACCYPEEMIGYYDWDKGLEAENDYWIYVYFNTDSPLTKSYGISASYRFLKGQVPAFVAEDTRYQE